MMNWWRGKGAEGSHSQDGNSELEPPETPAPVFAARALKSAIFGTPAPPADDTLGEIDRPLDTTADIAKKPRQSMDVSPTKPQGILMTPGTAASRRKTVSFGSEVVDTVGLPAGRLRRSGKVDEPIENTASGGQLDRRRASRKPSFTSMLENAREESLAKAVQTTSLSEVEPQENPRRKTDGMAPHGPHSRPDTKNKGQKSISELRQQLLTQKDKLDGDVTMDLNEPNSESGKYWKSQYQSYHDEAKVEMQNLLKSKHLIKSFAKTKDEKALSLAEELREQQQTVINMKSEIWKLSCRLAKAGLDGAEDNTPELIKELTKQTALALEYKAQAQTFQTALEVERTRNLSNKHQKSLSIPPGSEQPPADTQQEQLHDVAAIRNPLNMHKTLPNVEGTNCRLQEENTRLTTELQRTAMRLEECRERSEKRWQSSQEQYRKKDDAMKTLENNYNVLKEQAKSQRGEAEKLLRKKRDQAMELKKEIASMRGVESTIQDLRQTLQKKTSEHNRIVLSLRDEIAQLKPNNRREPGNLTTLEYSDKQQAGKTLALDESFQTGYSPILEPAHTPSRSSKTQASPRSKTPVGHPRPTHPELLEIINHATVDTIPPKTSGPVQYTPLARRFADMTLESPQLQLPSALPLPRSAGRQITELKDQVRLRPAMFNITSSPPKLLQNAREERRPMSVLSGHLSSLNGSKARNPLTPERAAAARARLQRKNAERKRRQALEADKENH